MQPVSRSILDNEITSIRDNLILLGSRVDYAIRNALDALYQRDVALSQKVEYEDQFINQLRYQVEKQCLTVLATQQPAAIDLRTVVAAIHIAGELERIGDHASGIARLVGRMEDEDDLHTLHKVPKMARRAREMVQDGLNAFVQHDVDLAFKLMKRDGKIDKHYEQLTREVLSEMADQTYVRRATFLLWVGHGLERIGDRATNIAERVIFMISGDYVDDTP